MRSEHRISGPTLLAPHFQIPDWDFTILLSVYHAAVLLLLYPVPRSTSSLFFVRMTFKVPRLTNALKLHNQPVCI